MDKKGFTLVELLIVIAIIGVLSSVILASLNSARGKGGNAAVKGDLANIRSQAAIFLDDHTQSYVGVCSDAKVLSILNNASSTGGGTYGCTSDDTSWSAYAQLKTPEAGGGYWCSNSSGFSKAISTVTSWATSSCQ